jgi:hypothetical protein
MKYHSKTTRLWAGRFRVQILGGPREFSLIQNIQTGQTGSVGHPASCTGGATVLYWKQNYQGVKLTTYLDVVLMLRTSDTIHLFTQYSLKVWTGKVYLYLLLPLLISLLLYVTVLYKYGFRTGIKFYTNPKISYHCHIYDFYLNVIFNT